MPRLLALDWDDNEARYVVATTRDARVVIEAAGTVEVPAGDGQNRERFGPALAEALAPQKIGRCRTLVAVDRSQFELLNLSLPPCTDAELPNLVRMQATRESSVVTDDTVLDFVPLSDNADEPRRIAALALSPQRRKEVESICTVAGVAASSIVVRPYSAAALLAAWPDKPAGPCLVVNTLGDEVDLCVVRDERVVMWRTLRQSNASDNLAAAKRLSSEIQRTLLVAAGALERESITATCLFGTADEHPALVEQLSGDFAGSLAIVDPFTLAEGSAGSPPGRFAACLGALSVEARGGRHAIDFLNPRKTPAPPDRRRMLSLAGAAAALFALLLGYTVWSNLAEVDAENETLSAELDRLDEQFKLAGKRQKVVQALRDWNSSDVNWLDELRDLSLRLPSGRDVVLQRMAMSDSRGSGGNIEMTGVVRDPAIVSRIESSVRDKYHQINSRHVQEREQDKSYAWHFEAQLVIEPRVGKEYASHLAGHLTADAAPEDASQKTPPDAKPQASRASGER